MPTDLDQIIGWINMVATGGVGAMAAGAVKHLYSKYTEMGRQLVESRQRESAADRKIEELTKRIIFLEASRDWNHFPMWTKNYDGRFQSCNSSFVKRVLLPLGIRFEDIYGKTVSEVPQFSQDLVDMLSVLDSAVRREGSASVSEVTFYVGGPKMTILKTVSFSENGQEYISVAAPTTDLSLYGISFPASTPRP